MHCRNCLTPNPLGTTHCVACRMPGDFGQAPREEAPVIHLDLVGCDNCGAHAPRQAAHCPTCRWPLPTAALPPAEDLPPAVALPPAANLPLTRSA